MKIRSVLSTVMVLLLMVINAGAVPNVPQRLSGDVSIDGSPANDGIIITAMIGNTVYASTTTVGGKYGNNPPFYVPEGNKTSINDNTLIKLYVKGFYAAEFSYESMKIRQIDLSIKTGTTETPVVTSSRPPSGGPSGGQANNPNIPPPMPPNVTVQSTSVVSPTVPVNITSAPGKAQDLIPSGTPVTSAIDIYISIVTLFLAGIIVRNIGKNKKDVIKWKRK